MCAMQTHKGSGLRARPASLRSSVSDGAEMQMASGSADRLGVLDTRGQARAPPLEISVQ